MNTYKSNSLLWKLNKLNVLFLLLVFISNVNADLPVHCLIDNVKGDWTFHVNKEKFSPSLKDEKTTCGHGFPNKVEQLNGDVEFKYDNEDLIKFTLLEDHTVRENGLTVGKWTPVYDQSFVIYYKDSILTAPFKYYKNNEEVVSNCSKTMIGWIVRDKNHKDKDWSCFYAVKNQGTAYKNFLQVSKQETNFGVKPIPVSLIQTTLQDNLKYEQLHTVVKEINEANEGWKAQIHPEFVGMSLSELKANLGLVKGKSKVSTNEKNGGKADLLTVLLQTSSNIKDNTTVEEFLSKLNQKKDNTRNNPVLNEQVLTSDIISPHSKVETTQDQGDTLSQIKRDKNSQDVTDYAEVVKYINTPLEEIDENTLPLNWDWRNVGGISYIPNVKVQGACGSCYTFSSITSLESRLRIMTNNKDTTQFSVQFPLSCNFYSEGCDGGYPYFVGKFFNEFEIVPEECFPYKENNDRCGNVCDYTKYKKKYKVTKYDYIGGFYGGTNEVNMLKELRARGPIPGNIRVPYTFNYYKTGVYSAKHLEPSRSDSFLSKTTMVDRHLSWEKVEHSITLVGYGEEKGVKYWIGMNTWGTGWGEDGFFKILRGQNECSIESMGDVLQLEILDR